MDALRGLLLLFPLVSVLSVPLEDDFLLVGGGSSGSVYQLARDGSSLHQINASSGGNVVGVDYDPATKQVYWTDTTKHAVFRAHLNGSGLETVIHLTQASSPEGVAVDAGAGLVFFTDSGRATVSVHSLQTGETRTVLSQAKHPRTLRLNPQHRLLYWTDWGRQTIERMRYDGSDHVVLVSVTDSWINGLALDLADSRMFWADSFGNWINSSRVDGAHVRGVLQTSTARGSNNSAGASHLYGVAAGSEYLYFTDWYNNHVYRVRRDGSDLGPIGPEFSVLYDIIVYVQSRHVPGPRSACLDSNGGCSHICIPAASGDVTCACPDNRRLAANQSHACTDMVTARGPDLVWLEHDDYYTGYVRGVRGSPRDYLASREVRTWTVRSPAWYWTALDAHYPSSSLVLLDKFDKLVVLMSLNGTKVIRGVYYGTSSEAHGVAVDWRAGTVYWTDALYNHVMVAALTENTNLTRALVRTGLDKPHGIALHPYKGLLFWSDWGEVDKIEVCSLAGRGRRVLVHKHLNKPLGLAVDYTANRLYWASDSSLESIALDGTDRQTFGTFPNNQFVDIALHGDYLFATDAGSGSKPYVWFYRLDDAEGRGVRLGLARRPYGIAVYHSDKQLNGTGPCSRLSCHHLCVSAAGGSAECLCKEGFHMTDQRMCSRDLDVLELGYTYSLGDRLCSVRAAAATSRLERDPVRCVFNRSTASFQFHALDFNAHSGQMYFSDAKFKVKSIRRASWNNKNNNSILIHGTGVVEGVAVDWTCGLLYWTDSTYRQLWVAREDGILQKVLVTTRDAPRALAVDPLHRKLYWVENTVNVSQPVIKVSAMDGSNIRTFVANSLRQPTGLAIDFRLQRLYWADMGNNRIEYMTLDGQDRVVQRLPQHRTFYPYDVAILQDYLAFTERDELADRSGLRLVEKDTGHEVNDGFFLEGHLAYDVVATDTHNQPMQTGRSGCVEQNGGCEQLCLSRDVSHYMCACIDGMMLQSDNKTCRPEYDIADEFFLVADDYRHQIYQLNRDMSHVNALPFSNYDRPIGLEFDFVENRIYWTDFHKGVIKRAFLNGSREQVIRQDMPNSRVDGLAFEPEARLLYFADLEGHMIGILNPSGQHVKVLVAEDLLQPRSIVLDPTHGYMYFSSSGKIERSDMDGLGRMQLVNTTLGWISGLALDLDGGRLYWCDHHAERVSVVDLDGTNRRVLHQMASSADPFSLAKVDNMIYWTDWNLRGISAIDAQGRHLRILHDQFFTGLNDLKFYSRRQLAGPNQCSHNNGGCSHFCIPTPAGRVCACPDDDQGAVPVSADGLNCPGVPACIEDVLHGHIDQGCSRRLGTRCSWTCQAGYSPSTQAMLICNPGMDWNLNMQHLCKELSCELLKTPDNSEVDESCPYLAGEGATCEHTCRAGFEPVAGDSRRTCRSDTLWTGTPLICVSSRTIAEEAQSAGPSTLLLIVALGATFLVAFLAIVIIGICLCRRHAGKNRHGQLQEAPEASNPGPALAGEPAPVYDVTGDQLKLDAALAFANPGYITHAEARGARPPTADNDTSFVNPMFATEGKLTDKTGEQEDEEEGHYDTIPALRMTSKQLGEEDREKPS